MQLISNAVIALKISELIVIIFDQSEGWKYHLFQNDYNKVYTVHIAQRCACMVTSINKDIIKFIN